MDWKSKNRYNLIFILLFLTEAEPDEITGFKLNLSENLSGFQRNLCYNVQIENMPISSILIKETLPKDMYVDPYQVSGSDGILVKDLTDCEIPAYLASSQAIMLCSISKTGIHQICLPVHFRYQVPHNCKIYGTSATVGMAIPSISVRKVNNYSNAVSLGCFKMSESLMHHGNPNVQPLNFKIPVGCTEDFYPVLCLTAAIISLSTVYLYFNLLKINDAFFSITT